MKISELNHLENVNESNVVKGGYVSVGTDGYAFADGIYPFAYSDSYVSVSKSEGYDYYYGYYESEYGSGGSFASANALAGYASVGTYAYASTGY